MQDFSEEPQFFVTEYHNQTNLHPLALVSLVLLCLLTLLLPRKYALLPSFVLICFIPAAQRVVILGLDFTLLRIMAFTGCARVLFRGEYRMVRWQGPDTVLVLWAMVTCTAYALLWGQLGKVIYILGTTTEALAIYFFVRPTVRTWSDLWIVARTLVVLGVVVSLAFLVEKSTHRNVFSVFGGVPEMTPVREGRLRCMGAFMHPILAGCAWAALAPYMAALWWKRASGARIAAVAGVVSAMVIIITCASSTPAGSFLAGALAGMWFAFRNYSRLLRYGVAFTLIALHMVMNRPVWHLLARIDIAGGSTGWHRYYLIDSAISRLSEWALIGTKSTYHWGPQLFDVTNQYIAEGIHGGILGLTLFVLMIWKCLARVGSLWRSVGANREQAAMAWALGVALFVHVVSFIGVTYFGQITFAYYFALAAIVSMAEPLSTKPGRASFTAAA